MADVAQRLANLSPAQRQLLEQRLKTKPQVAQPIAIVGMACRFPGANTPEEYWDVICKNKTTFREIPADRWDAEAFYDEDPDTPAKMATKWCAFVDNVREFDSLFFGIAPREARKMDPQQRLLLEVSWEALENAGIAPDQLAGSATGVFVGIGNTDYSKVPTQFSNYYETIDAHIGTGNALSIAANRISYIMDFRGPSLAVDTACSSGSVALHYAVQDLCNGTCDAALAGAVNLIIVPDVTMAFSKARMLSPTGKCRPFDAAADGYVRGEGCAMILLRRLTDAMRDRDNILAVIRSTAINQDGRTSGITAPNSLSQQSCIRNAQASAGVEPKDFAYIEAHGTGTPLGDPIEFQSLSKVFAKKNDSDPPVYVSSVKANIGHTETVSGIAGLMKVVMMMKKGLVPGHTGMTELNPNIHLEGSRLVIPAASVPWPEGQARIAGISSFGFGGTNSHIVVEAAAPVEQPSETPSMETADRPFHVLAISARTKAALPAVAANYRRRLQQLADDELADFCAAANVGRAHFNHRAAMVADSRQALLGQLEDVANEKPNPVVKVGEVSIATKPRVAMLFTGQGAQYAGMGQSLYDAHPAFRAALDQCDAILQPILGQSLREIVFHDTVGLINETAITQPALFALEYAMARLWQSWGVEPSVMLGHSVGEYVAACIAGVFSLEDGLKLIAKRAALMQELPASGSMAVIFANRQTVEARLRKHGKGVAVATANGPENNVISGKCELIEKIIAEFETEGIGTQKLRVSHAFHSPLMDPMLDEFEQFASTITYERPTIPIVANCTGKIIESGDFNASYWRDHIRNAVEFSDGMICADELGIDAYLEVGPTSSLLGMGRRVVPKSKAIWVASMRKGRDEWKTLLGTLSELYVLGIKLNWQQFDAPWTRQFVSLPNYPFQRLEYWMEGETAGTGGKGPSIHPLLGTPINTALKSKVYEARLAADSPNFLQDHIVQGSIVVPAAAYVEMGLAAGRQAFGAGNHAVENIAIQQALFLPAEGGRFIETILGSESGGRATFEAYSVDAQTEQPDAKWQLHVTGTVVHQDTITETKSPRLPDLDQFRENAIHDLSRDEVYEIFAARSLDYGPCFQVTQRLMRNEKEAVASLKLDQAVSAKLHRFHIHPALGDAMMQITAGVIPLQDNNDHAPYSYIPMRIRSFRKLRDLEEEMWIYAIRTSSDDRPSPEVVEADVFLVSPDNKIIAEARGVTIQRIGRSIIDDVDHDLTTWMHNIQWQPADAVSDQLTAADRTFLIFGDPDGIGLELARRVVSQGGKVALVSFGDSATALTEAKGIFTAEIDPTNADQYAKLLEQIAVELGNRLSVVHCAALETTPLNTTDTSLAAAIEATCASPLRIVQALTRSHTIKKAALWFVTQGAQSIIDNESTAVQQTPLWGLGRVAALEAAELHCRLIDLQPNSDNIDTLLAETLAEADENQIAYRNDQRYVARVVETPEQLADATEAEGIRIPTDSDYRLRIRSAGSFDALEYEAYEPQPPGPGQVDVEIRATGLNFSDVLKALGLYPGIQDIIVPMGIECAGIVRAVGEGVQRFQRGDEVMGVVPYAFASRGITAEYALVKKPTKLDHEEAATIPITFLTAYYGLVRLADLQQGERVLIHAGAGGVGLAAIQIAKAIGAEIFATAGSDDKRDFLKSLGVHHVMNSRTLEFADQIAEITSHEGIDVVLNSLPGDAIEKSLECLRAYGRFLEIGKTDIYSNSKIGLLPFQDNLSYFAIDLDRMLRQRSDYIRDMFAEVMTYFQAGTYQALPLTQFETNDTIGAFRYMAQRKNIGKVVVTMQQQDADAAAARQPSLVREDGTYLITGGLGALGLRVAERLIADGAGAVALLSRRAPDVDKQARMDQLAAGGATVIAIQGDVADKKSLESAIGHLPSDLPPLRGVVHAAGVLADGVMFDMDLDQLHVPLVSKIIGTWNLHEATLDDALDFFVMFSSVACVIGSPGQGNYAAGNAFLDGLVAYRRGRNLPATSINWGPWAESGMAAQASRDTQLSSRGMHLLPGDEALEVLSRIIQAQVPQAAVMSVNWSDLIRAMGGNVPPILREVATTIEMGADEGSAEDRAFREALLAMQPAERHDKLVSFFANQLANIMGMVAADVDVVAPLNTMGMDSLMAIELKNKIERRLQTTLPMSALIHEPSVNSLAAYLADNYGQDAAEESGETETMTRTDRPSAVAGPHSGSSIPSDA